MDSASIQAMFTGLAALIGAIVAGFVVWNGRKVHEALKTFNDMKPGEQIDAATLARLRAKPHDERTPTEQAHLDSAPPQEAAQGPVIAAIYDAVNGKPADQPSLYDVVATLDLKVDHNHATLMERFDELERHIGG